VDGLLGMPIMLPFLSIPSDSFSARVSPSCLSEKDISFCRGIAFVVVFPDVIGY